jgi:four helix bundle protein
MELVTRIYVMSKKFPRDEFYGLTSQIRRSAISIPSNIAEGRGKRSTKDFIRFFNIAYGSLAELETQIIIGQNLGFVTEDETEPVLSEASKIGRMINGMIAGLERKLDCPRMPNAKC